MSVTAAAQLSAVQDAIAALLAGGAVKSYEIGGRRLDKYTLKELQDLEKFYQAKVDIQTKGIPTNRMRFDSA